MADYLPINRLITAAGKKAISSSITKIYNNLKDLRLACFFFYSIHYLSLEKAYNLKFIDIKCKEN